MTVLVLSLTVPCFAGDVDMPRFAVQPGATGCTVHSKVDDSDTPFEIYAGAIIVAILQLQP